MLNKGPSSNPVCGIGTTTVYDNPRGYVRLGVEVYSRVIPGELLEIRPNKPLAQGTRLGYIVTEFLNKEISSDTEINPILVEVADDLAGPNAADEPTKDINLLNKNQFHIEDSKRQNEISLDEERIKLTNLALMDNKIKEPEDNSSLQLTELYTTREKPINTEPTSHKLKTYKKPDFCSTFLNLTKKYLSFVAEGPHTIDVPNDQVLRGHNFSPHGT